MATKPGSKPKNEFVFFDVVYEDGSQRSNRRVPAELLGGLEKDEPARGFFPFTKPESVGWAKPRPRRAHRNSCSPPVGSRRFALSRSRRRLAHPYGLPT